MDEKNLIIEVFRFKKGFISFKPVLIEANTLLVNLALDLPENYREDYFQVASCKLNEITKKFEFFDLIDELKNIKSNDQLKSIISNQKVFDYFIKEQKCYLKVARKNLIFERKKFVNKYKKWWNVVLFDKDEVIVSSYQENYQDILASYNLSQSDFEFINLILKFSKKEIAKKLNISQQTISRKLQKIREKINK